MPKYKIKYLNLRARAEPIRLLFNYVQHPYEDSRENFLEFSKYKDKFPLPHLPKLVVDGEFELSYTSVILAYLGEKFGSKNGLVFAYFWHWQALKRRMPKKRRFVRNWLSASTTILTSSNPS